MDTKNNEPKIRKLLIDADEIGIPLNVSLNYHFRNKYCGNKKAIVEMVDYTDSSMPIHLEEYLREECSQLIPDIYVSSDFLYSVKTHYEMEIGVLRRGSISRTELMSDSNSTQSLDFEEVWGSNGISFKHGSYCMSFFPKKEDFLKFMKENEFTDFATASPLLAGFILDSDEPIRLFYMVKQTNYLWGHKNKMVQENKLSDADKSDPEMYLVNDIFHLYQVCVAIQNEGQ